LRNAIANLKVFPRNEKAQQTLLMILVSVECGIPPSYLLRYKHYYHLRQFLKSQSTGYAWFLALTGDSDKGGLSDFPAQLPTKVGSPSTLWRFLEILRAPRKNDRGQLRGLDWKMFSQISTDQVGFAVRKVLGGSATNSKITNSEAYALLEGYAKTYSRYRYPGFVSGVLAGELPEVLNRFEPEDVIRHHGGPDDVKMLDGEQYRSRLPEQHRFQDNIELQTFIEEIAWDSSLDEAEKAAKIWSKIQETAKIYPGIGWLQKRLKSCRVPGTQFAKIDHARATRIASKVLKLQKEAGELRLTAPLRLPTKAEMVEKSIEVHRYVDRYRPRGSIDQSEEDLARRRVAIPALAHEYIDLILAFGLRDTEAFRVIVGRKAADGQGSLQPTISSFGDDFWLWVPGTKSKGAKRVVSSFYNAWPENTDRLKAGFFVPHSAPLRGLRALVKNAVESVDASLHLIRHWDSIICDQQLREKHYLTGSGLLVLESLTARMGHYSCAVTWPDYHGNAMVTPLHFPSVYPN
jgi:hypothetical protein